MVAEYFTPLFNEKGILWRFFFFNLKGWIKMLIIMEKSLFRDALVFLYNIFGLN